MQCVNVPMLAGGASTQAAMNAAKFDAAELTVAAVQVCAVARFSGGTPIS